MKKQLLKAISLIMAVSMLCSCAAKESISSSVPEISSTPETTSTSATSGNDETSKPETEDISKDETTTTETTISDIPETTTIETTISPETEASTPAPETAPPAPLWTETEVNKTMYVTVGCYSRKDAIQGAETVSLYNVNDKVKIIAETNTGYCKLENGAFIHKDYLSNNKVVITTTTAATTPKPVETKPVSTTPATTTTAVQTPPVEYSTRTEEIKACYNVKYEDVKTLTKSNINNFEKFVNVCHNFYYDTSVDFNKNGYDIFFNYYTVYYNLDTNSIDKYITDSYIEKIVFLSLLNEEYINDETFKKILGIYTYDELKGINRNAIYIFCKDMENQRYYDYSKIVINKNLRMLLTNVQNAYKEKDYVTLEKLCNENFGKYNTMVDSILLSYEKLSNEINNYPTEETAFELAEKTIDDMGIYDRLHS